MIWYSTNYFNKDFITESGVTEKKYEDQTTYQPYIVILGITHTLGEAKDEDAAKAWLDKWMSDGERADREERMKA
jgi:hypothetical protein